MLLDNQNVSLAFLCRPYVAGHFASQGKITTKNERNNNRNTVASKAFNAEITGVNHFFRQKNPEADMTNRIISD